MGKWDGNNLTAIAAVLFTFPLCKYYKPINYMIPPTLIVRYTPQPLGYPPDQPTIIIVASPGLGDSYKCSHLRDASSGTHLAWRPISQPVDGPSTK